MPEMVSCFTMDCVCSVTSPKAAPVSGDLELVAHQRTLVQEPNSWWQLKVLTGVATVVSP